MWPFFADVSSNNPLPDIAAYAAAGHRCIMLKATEGVGYRWAEASGLTALAHAHGLAVGHYGWLRPEQSAIAEADTFVAAVLHTLRQGDYLVCDYERTQGLNDPDDRSRAAQLADWMTRVRLQVPVWVPIFVYTGLWYLDGRPAMQAEVRKHSVFVSYYNPGPVPNPYGLHYAAWQYTDRATVAGISAPVDDNQWLITPPYELGDITIMDAETKAYLDKQFAALHASIDWPSLGSDGVHHRMESIVAHVTQGAQYASGQGAKWPALARAIVAKVRGTVQ